MYLFSKAPERKHKRILIICDHTIGELKNQTIKRSDTTFTFLYHPHKDLKYIYESEKKSGRLSATGYDILVLLVTMSPIDFWESFAKEVRVEKFIIILPRNHYFTNEEVETIIKIHEKYPNVDYSTVLIDLFLPSLYLKNECLTVEGRNVVLDSIIKEQTL